MVRGMVRGYGKGVWLGGMVRGYGKGVWLGGMERGYGQLEVGAQRAPRLLFIYIIIYGQFQIRVSKDILDMMMLCLTF